MDKLPDHASTALGQLSRHLGARNDLKNLVKTHLFVLCPNNSGSTYLERAIAECEQVWSLNREGQHVFGYLGPASRGTNTPLAWNADQETAQLFSDASNYRSWESTKKAWYFQATAKSENASIFITRSPPFLLIPRILEENFPNAKFICMVRNPYAVAEGITRRRPEMARDRNACLELAARHIVACMKSQQENIMQLGKNSVFLTYEEMCQSPDAITDRIRSLVPELVELTLDKMIKVKNYHQHLHDFNQEQIARLSNSDITCLNQIFLMENLLFKYFGYEIMMENPE